MIIKVLSKIEFNRMCEIFSITNDNVEQFKDVFFISINNALTESQETAKSYFDSNKENVLILAFDDVEADVREVNIDAKSFSKHFKRSDKLLAKAFTKSQAEEIVDFVIRAKERGATKCIVHCSAGISRSGAVGAFVSDYFEMPYSEFKTANPHVLENRHVSRLLNNCLREKLNKNEAK